MVVAAFLRSGSVVCTQIQKNLQREVLSLWGIEEDGVWEVWYALLGQLMVHDIVVGRQSPKSYLLLWPSSVRGE